MRIAIFHKQTGKAEKAAERAESLLRSRGAEVVYADGEAERFADRILVLGGDGTVLKAVRASVPLVGVNYGTLGFLCEFCAEELEKACETVLDRNAAVTERTMLETSFGGNSYHALNEIAFLRRTDEGTANRVLSFYAEFDGIPFGTVSADGVIFGTPTGSTAYSISAGGSVLSPDCANFAMTFVCPLSASLRSMVYPDSRSVTLSVKKGAQALIYCDGIFVGAAEEITVKKSSRTAKFLTREFDGDFRRFYEKIQRRG